MNKFMATLIVPIGLLLNTSASAEEDMSDNATLEMVEVTIRMTAGHPYGELRMCEECPLRLLPFVPGALVTINGHRMTADSLQDGQSFEGTVFLHSQPIDSINRIIAK